MIKMKSMLAGLLLGAFFIGSASAQSGVGQLAPGQVYANASAVKGLGAPTTLSPLLNRGFCSTASNFLANIGGTWGCASLASALSFTGSVLGISPGTITSAMLAQPLTLVAPVLGAATATSINGLAITSSAGTLTIPNSASAILALSGNFSTTITATGATNAILPNGTHTLVGQDTTDILTNKTFNTGGAGNSFQINGTTISTNTGTTSVNVLQQAPTINQPNLVGSTTNDSAAAGSVGELIFATILSGSAVTLTTGNAITIASIVLTAGDWDISAQPSVTGSATTTFTGVRSSISTTIATENAVAPFYNSQSFGSLALLATFDYGTSISPIRVSISGSTTYYLIIRANFATSSSAGYGSIRARRVR